MGGWGFWDWSRCFCCFLFFFGGGGCFFLGGGFVEFVLSFVMLLMIRENPKRALLKDQKGITMRGIEDLVVSRLLKQNPSLK